MNHIRAFSSHCCFVGSLAPGFRLLITIFSGLDTTGREITALLDMSYEGLTTEPGNEK